MVQLSTTDGTSALAYRGMARGAEARDADGVGKGGTQRLIHRGGYPPMHSLVVLLVFLAMVLLPCLIASRGGAHGENVQPE